MDQPRVLWTPAFVRLGLSESCYFVSYGVLLYSLSLYLVGPVRADERVPAADNPALPLLGLGLGPATVPRRGGRAWAEAAGGARRPKSGGRKKRGRATPLRWDELGRLRSGAQYDVGNLRRRLAALREDPWEGFFRQRQSITQAARRAVGLA